MFLEVLHGHGREVEQLVGDLVGSPQNRRDPDVVQHLQHLVQDAAGEEAAVLSFYVLAKAHLQERQPHMTSLDDITFAGQGVVASRRFAAMG